jgi:hypothetical protein
MRIVLAAASAFALAACGGEPAKPAEPAPEASAAAAPAMDDGMKAADSADDATVEETADGAMFHTDTTKTEKVHLPAGNWTATPVDGTQIEVVGATDEAMPGGVTHHIVEVKPLTKDVIARVKFERRDSADAAAPVTETRTVNFMVH